VAAALCCADLNAAGDPQADAPPSVPQESILSSFRQAFKEDFNREVVRGHFDVGTAPDAHRFYCLVDVKTGKREPKAVSGEPVPRVDGMTGIKASAVSLYACDSAEQRGILVTTGYVLNGSAAASAAPATRTQYPPETRGSSTAAPAKPDVAGVKLGMSGDEVRAVLKSKKLLDYYESTDVLRGIDTGDGGKPGGSGRYLNVIAAWTPPASVAAPEGDWESYEVMFTPVPGKERAMAIVHTQGSSHDDGTRETELESGLLKKYGGFSGAEALPASPTWRIQSGGEVLVGDSCNRRELFGGLAGYKTLPARTPNLALRTTPDEFRYQIEQCGTAIVTADHATADGTAARPERIVTRFTVSAYSPAIAFEGATMAAQLMQTAGAGEAHAAAPRNTDLLPNL